MKDFILRLLFIIVAAELVSIFILNRPKAKVLSEATVMTPSPTEAATPTPVPTPTETPTPKPTKKPTPTPIPQPKFTSEQINGFIERFAAQYNVDPNLVRHIAVCESGFNPFAKSLTYAGLFQFGPVTWQNIRVAMGEDKDVNLRYNAEEAVQTAAYVLHINDAGIWPNCVHN